MSRWINFLVITGVVAAMPAGAATIRSVKFDLKPLKMKIASDRPDRATLKTVFDGDDWTPVVAPLPRNDDYALAATEATTHAVVTTGSPMVRVNLELQPLAGHRSFDTMTTRRGTLGLVVANRGNELGVGTTATYGIRLARAWRFTPFASVDYNRVDSARYVDVASPRPFMRNNADTGLTASMGATLSHRFGSERRMRAVAYGALIAAADATSPPREFGSIGSRLIHALGHSGVDALWQEVGMGLDYRLSPRATVNGSLIQTVDRLGGDTAAAKLGLRIAL